MKTIVPFKKTLILILMIPTLLTSLSSMSQGIPDLQFTNPTLESGTAGEDGATYRFSLVTAGVDALVQITGRSSSAVVLSNIDTVGAGMGYDKAFQPVLGIPGTAPANSIWSMDFQLTFVQTGTTKKMKVSQFNATGLDIDGDGVTLNEWTIMNGIQSIDSAVVNNLTFTKLGSHGANGDDYKVEGIIANSPGIDTTAKNVMATYKYVNKDQINFTIGAKTSAATTTAGMRLNSIWFKDFLGTILPVKMMSFTAALDGNKTDLQWTTASETNTSKFVIEKSYNGHDFTGVAEVTASGNTNTEITYNYNDNVSEDGAGFIYYRLQSVDIDGKSEYSDTKMIRIARETSGNFHVLAYPNPASDQIHITVPVTLQNKKLSYELFNANGQSMKKMTVEASGQTETLNLNNLTSGIYIVSVAYEGGRSQQKIFKK